MQTTKIEYGTHHWPIWTGCAQPPSVCATRPTCWARGLHERFGKQWAHLYNPDFSPKFNPQLLYMPSLVRKPSTILVAFTGDMFGPGMEGDKVWQVLQEVAATPRHQYLFLTKSPENLAQFSPWPANAWVGASATDAATLDSACRKLWDVQAKIKWISLEPLLAWQPLFEVSFPPHISWVVVGAQSGPGAVKPKLDNVLDIILAADKAGIPIWIKNNLLRFYPPLPIRQEYPK